MEWSREKLERFAKAEEDIGVDVLAGTYGINGLLLEWYRHDEEDQAASDPGRMLEYRPRCAQRPRVPTK